MNKYRVLNAKKGDRNSEGETLLCICYASRVCLTISTTPHLSVIASTSDQTKRFGCNGSTNTANIAVAII